MSQSSSGPQGGFDSLALNPRFSASECNLFPLVGMTYRIAHSVFAATLGRRKPAWCSFKMPMICLSENLERFMPCHPDSKLTSKRGHFSRPGAAIPA